MRPTIPFTTSFIILLTGCTAAQMNRLRGDEQIAERSYAAATQASASARVAAESLPAGAPGKAEALKTISSVEKSEQSARLALDLAQAALNAVQKQDAADPALKQSLTTAINALPTPWTPVLASLVPAAVPLVVSVMQSVRLGRANQTVLHVTAQLDAHKTVLQALTVNAKDTRTV